MTDPTAPSRYLLGLLFDPHLREQHGQDPARAMDEFGLDPDQARAFDDLSLPRLQVDADGRRRYLMSALCRAYPLTAGSLGAAPGGPDRLAAFLASPVALQGAAARNAAFGGHLARLLELDAMGAGEQVVDFLRPFLALEHGLVQTAAQLRAAVGRGQTPPGLRKWSAADRRRLPLVLPGHLLAVSLPVSPEVLRAALHGLRAEDAWQRIRGGDLSWARVQAVARAQAQPVTLLARALVKGLAIDRGGAGGVAPLVEVVHRTAELAGPSPALLRQCDGSMRLPDLPDKQRRLAQQLLDAGLLSLGLDSAGLDSAGLDSAGLVNADLDNADADNADADNARGSDIS